MGGNQDAASALAEIGRRQEGVIDRVNVPAWYWWFVGLGMIPVGVAADTKNARWIVATALVYGLAVLVMNLRYTLGEAAGARVSRQLLGPAGAVAIVAFVWVVVGLSLGAAFGLQALGYGHPGAAGTVVGAVLVIGGGPLLSKRLRSTMLANRT